MEILVIEDDERIVNFLRRGFEAEGHRLDRVKTKAAAQDALSYQANSYDVIIIDWQLGSEDGLEICQEFRKSKVRTPILIMSAKGEVDVGERSLKAGANAFLAKPFSFEALLSLMKQLTFSNPSPV